MTEMQPGPLGQSQHDLRPRDTPLPMITMDFDGGGNIIVTLDGLPANTSVYGAANESEPTQELNSTGTNTYAATYTRGSDTTYTVEVGPSSGSPQSAVLTVNIPATAGRVWQRAQPRPDIVVAVCDSGTLLHVSSSPDGGAFSDPAATSLGLGTTVPPAACTLRGLPSVAAQVDGHVELRQLRDGSWQPITLQAGLPTSGIGGVAMLELGGRVYLALTHAASVQVWQTSNDLLSAWTRAASFSTPGALATCSLATDGRRLMLGWSESQTLNVAVAEYDSSGGLVWSERGPVLAGTHMWVTSPSLAASGAFWVLGCVDQGGQAWISRSNDFGVTWSGPVQPFSEVTAGPLALARHFGRLYLAAVQGPDGQVRVLRSSDGLAWSSPVTLVGTTGQPWLASGAPGLAGGPAVQPG